MGGNIYISVYMHPSAGYYLVQKIRKVKRGKSGFETMRIFIGLWPQTF